MFHIYKKIRERGIPERINRTALDAMMAPGPLGDAIVSLCCFRVVPLRHRKVGSDQRGLGRKTRGGRSPRGNVEGVSPSNGDAAYKRPPGTTQKSLLKTVTSTQKCQKSLLKTVTSTQKYQKSLLKTVTSTQKSREK